MSSLFPVKNRTLVMRLESRKVLPRLIEAGSMAIKPPNNQARLILCSPEVHRASCRKTGLPDQRTRISLGRMAGIEGNTLNAVEFYDPAGSLIGEPIPVDDLDDDLANAIQVELFAALLDASGCPIPMM